MAAAVGTSPLGLAGKIIAQAGSGGLVCLLLWYVLTSTVPSLQRDFRAELHEERTAYRDSLQAVRNSNDNEARQLAQVVELNRKAASESTRFLTASQKDLAATQQDLQLAVRDLADSARKLLQASERLEVLMAKHDGATPASRQ